jgi:hypothetical protein
VKRKSVLFVLLVAAVVLAAWRVAAPSSGKAAGEPSGSLSFEEDGSSTGAADSAPAVMEMSVFSRTRSEADELPSEYSYRLHSMGECGDWERAHDACFGDQIGDESRLVGADLGQTHANLYAWPTTSGGVCWATGRGTGMCTNHFTPDVSAGFMGWDPDTPGTGAPGTLVGIVPDDVVAARVKVDEIDHDALVQDNGLFYELSDAAVSCQAVNSVTISYRDGSSDTISRKMIGWGWTSDPPDAGTQPARDNVDGLDDPPAPPPDAEPPRC